MSLRSYGRLVAVLSMGALGSCGDSDALPKETPAAGEESTGAAWQDQSLEYGFARVTVAEGFAQAVGFAFAPDERIFVAEKAGRVRLVRGGVLQAEPFLDLSVEVNGANDRGLLGIAVHPGFPAQPYVYLSYVYDPPEVQGKTGLDAEDASGARGSRVIRVSADPAADYARALPDSRVVLLGQNSTFENFGQPGARNDYARPACGVRGSYVADCLPADESSHTVGTIAFGPDGALYVGHGDGCDFTRAQPACTRALDVDSLAGKILRIDPITGAGLPDNPFAEADLGSNASKVYQLGLRNPFRFTFDRARGQLYVGDVGWNVWEEINRAGPGANFGWPCYEGGNGVNVAQSAYAEFARCMELHAQDVTPAFYAYTHDGLTPGQGSAVLVGDLYRGTTYPPLYRGALFYSDVNQRELRFLTFDEGGNLQSSQLFQDNVGYHTQITADPVSGDLFTLQLGGRPEAPESKLERIVFTGYGRGPAEGGYELRVASSQLCVQAQGDDGALALETRACTSDTRQRWLFTRVGGDLYRFASESSAAVLQMRADETSERLGLSVWEDLPDQRFRILPLADGSQIINEATERCLTVRGEGAGAPVVSAPCAGTPGQTFLIASAQNRAPTLAPVPQQLHGVGMQVELALTASDGEQSELTYFARGLPPGLSIDPQRGVIVGTLTRSGSYSVRVRVSDGELEASQAFAWYVQDDKLPTVTIDEPAEGRLYVAGESITFAGRATQVDGTPIEAQALSWELLSHHNQHVHFGGLPATIGASGGFVVDDHGDNTALELCLSAVDATGRTGRACRVLSPRTVDYTIESEPSGLTIPWEGVPRQTPFTVSTNVGGRRDLSAPALQEGSAFSSWSDGGEASHAITIGDLPRTFRATYAPAQLTP